MQVLEREVEVILPEERQTYFFPKGLDDMVLCYLSYISPKTAARLANDLKIILSQVVVVLNYLLSIGRIASFDQGYIKLAAPAGGDEEDDRGSGRVEVAG